MSKDDRKDIGNSVQRKKAVHGRYGQLEREKSDFKKKHSVPDADSKKKG